MQRRVAMTFPEREHLRVEMGRLDHDEAVSGIVVRERRVAVQRGQVVGRAVTVREQDDRQAASSNGCGDSYLEIDGAARGRQNERTDREKLGGCVGCGV